MSEAHADVVRRRSTPPAFDLRKRLDELARGECTEEEFVHDALERRGAATESTWYVLSLLDQRYRLGHLSDELFQSIKSRIALRELQGVDFGTTVELVPAPRAVSPAALPPPRAINAAAVSPPTLEAVTAPQVLAAGLVLRDRYTLEATIGSGGMATVFKAIDRCGVLPAEADRRVAVKVLRERINQKPGILIQLRREFYRTQVLSHPNIVKVYELDRDGDLAFYTMELLEGERLSDLIARARSQPLPRPYAWQVIRAVGSAVAHAHSRNVIHGDLKPQNVMVTSKGEIRVLDFGSSRTSTESAASGPLAATPPYACCEILEGQQPDPRDDLYALSCLAYELLSGSHPFELRSSIEARASAAHPRRPEGLSRRQWQALLTGLSWSREDRSVPVSEWLERLGLSIEPHRLPSLDAHESTPAQDPPRPLRIPQWLRLPHLSQIPPFPSMPTFAWRPRLSWLQRIAQLQPMDWPRIAVPLSLLLVALVAMLSVNRTPSRPPLPGPTIAAPMAVAVVPTVPTPVSTATIEPPAQAPISTPPIPVAKALTRLARAESIVAKPSISLTSRTYIARRDAHFIEVRVRRTDSSTDGQRFTWWTENGTAKAPKDFTAQARIARVFSSGRQFATLFIRVEPATARREAATFYVNIADPSAGTTLGGVSSAAVVLPAMP